MNKYMKFKFHSYILQVTQKLRALTRNNMHFFRIREAPVLFSIISFNLQDTGC